MDVPKLFGDEVLEVWLVASSMSLEVRKELVGIAKVGSVKRMGLFAMFVCRILRCHSNVRKPPLTLIQSFHMSHVMVWWMVAFTTSGVGDDVLSKRMMRRCWSIEWQCLGFPMSEEALLSHVT